MAKNLGVTKAQQRVNELESDVWLILNRAGTSQREIARRRGISQPAVWRRISRAQWRATRSPGRLDGLRKRLGLELVGTSVEIQTGQCGHVTLAGKICLVCNQADPAAAEMLARPIEPLGSRPAPPPKFQPRARGARRTSTRGPTPKA